jgi:hypothetical protein
LTPVPFFVVAPRSLDIVVHDEATPFNRLRLCIVLTSGAFTASRFRARSDWSSFFSLSMKT